MEAAAHTKGGFGGVPQKVGKEFVKADSMKKGGLYANLHAKQKRIAEGSGERMRKPGSKGAPTAEAFRESAKTKKMADGGVASLGGMVSSTPNTPTVASRDNSRELQPPQKPLGNPQQMADGGVKGGDGEQFYGYKKGGQVTTRRVSTGSSSKKSSNW
jgi:hypothetical protein